jgi:hypothetical protein
MRSTLAGRQRSVPHAFALVIAVIAGVFAFTTQRGEAHAGVLGHDHSVGPVGLPTAAEVAFHDQMRKLWEDHVTWTRLAIVEFADGSAGFDATATRLLQNQTDIGNAIAPFYGAAAGQELSTLLHTHITLAVGLLQDAKAGTPRPSPPTRPAGTTTPTRSPISCLRPTRDSGPMTSCGRS